MFGWERYQSIEKDFLRAREYVSFEIKDAYSDFFSKAVILLGAEIEGSFKKICENLGASDTGNISQYKERILKEYPGIINLHSHLLDTNIWLVPFHGWDKGKLHWWSVYTDIKHSLVDHNANCNVALNMLAAFQLLLFIMQMQEALKLGLDGDVETYLLSNAPRLIIPEISLSQGFVGSDSFFHQLFPVKILEQKLKSKEADYEVV